MMNSNMPPQEPQGPMRSWGTGGKVVVNLTDKTSTVGDLIYSDAVGIIIEERPDRQVFIPYAAIMRIDKRSAAR